MSLTFRWLGVAGVELKLDGQILAIDPFFTRPSLIEMLRPVASDAKLVAEKLPDCHFVLVTHPHYDHLLDVPEVLRNTGAAAYGSPNTCRLLNALGVFAEQLNEIKVGYQLRLGEYKVDVIRGQHSKIPFSGVFNGRLHADLHPPLRVMDYRMDVCLGYLITAGDVRMLICASDPRPADLLFAVAQESPHYYLRLFKGVQPRIFVPIHWDNFTRSLRRPIRRFARPGGMSLMRLEKLTRQTLPNVDVIIPELFREYTIR